MHKAVDDDLQLTHYAVGIFDRMSDASSIVQMKRLNVVAAELDRRARLVVKHVRQFIVVNGSPPLERHYHREIDQGSLTGLQWDWGDDGVEAWPNMDVSLVSIRDFYQDNKDPVLINIFMILTEGHRMTPTVALSSEASCQVLNLDHLMTGWKPKWANCSAPRSSVHSPGFQDSFVLYSFITCSPTYLHKKIQSMHARRGCRRKNGMLRPRNEPCTYIVRLNMWMFSQGINQ